MTRADSSNIKQQEREPGTGITHEPMFNARIIWDLEDDPNGNYWHIVVEGHGVTQDEVEEVLGSPQSETTTSRSSGDPITFGWTSTGKYIAVTWERVDDDPLTIYPTTAFEPTPQGE